MYYRYRVYSPINGRFTSADPSGFIGGVNQYLSCRNHPVDVRDPYGLLEDFFLSLTGEKTIWLTHRQVNPDRSITRVSYPVFSGQDEHRNKPESIRIPNAGPIPTGQYYIVDRPSGGFREKIYSRKKKWFALYYMDDVIDDEMTIDGVTRGNFRLHPGTISEGCITFVDRSQFLQVRELLLKTKTGMIPGTSIKYYGTITVSGKEEE